MTIIKIKYLIIILLILIYSCQPKNIEVYKDDKVNKLKDEKIEQIKIQTH